MTEGGFSAARLRALKIESGKRWGEIAALAGVSASYLHDLAGGRVDPTVARLVAIARAFNVSPLALLDEDDDGVWLSGWQEGVLSAVRELQTLRSRGPQ